MVDNVVAQWVLSAVFAVAAGYYLYGLARREERRHGPRLVVDDGLHVLMGVGMIVMLWPWGVAVPVTVYVVVFTAAALWFVARALFITSPGVIGAGDPPAVAGHHDSRGVAWYHAAMMASMVFMALAMNVGTATTLVPSAMPGASLSGMDMGSGGASGTSMAMPAASWVRLPSLVLAAGFVAAAVWLVVAGARSRMPRSVIAGAASGLMATGMAVVFVQMA